MKWQHHLWTGGSALYFVALALFAPTYASFFAVPHLVALSFRISEIRALVIAACLGLFLDLSSELFLFGFFSVMLSALTAFLYSLEHFFKKSRMLAWTLALTLTLMLALVQVIWLAITGVQSWMYFLNAFALIGIFTALLTLNGLITWALHRGQEKFDKLYSHS